MKRRKHRFTIVFSASVLLLSLMGMGTAQATASFTQGFETDTADWTSDVTRVATGSNSVSYNSGSTSVYADNVASATGGFNARITSAVSSGDCDLENPVGAGLPGALRCFGPFTRWGLGGPSTSVAQAFPSGGYTTQLDIYLDDDYAAAHPDCGQLAPCTPNMPGVINPACQTNPSTTDCEGSRFDWLTAFNGPSGNFIGQYVFNVGTGPNNSSGFPCAVGWVIAASTNAFRSGAGPYNLGKDPKCLAGSDWYTFRAQFRDNGGALAVDMDVLKPNGDVASCTNQLTAIVPCSWTLTGPPIDQVGCTPYGWFANEEINDLPIDNTLMDGCGKKSPTITTELSASGGIKGDTIHDSATLTGATGDAGGTVNYRYYDSQADCTSDTTGTAGHNVSTEAVTDGIVDNSDDVIFTDAGTFYWAAFYSGDAKNKAAKSDCASEPLEIATQVAKITPTGTTCQQYQGGTAATLAQVFYSVKGGKISAVNPGVFFYYTRVTGNTGDTVDITQSHTGSAPIIPIQQKQVLLYSDPGCATLKWKALTVRANGTATGTLPSNGSFIISVKYDTASLKGQPAPGSSPTTYTFETSRNGGRTILADIARVDLVKK